MDGVGPVELHLKYDILLDEDSINDEERRRILQSKENHVFSCSVPLSSEGVVQDLFEILTIKLAAPQKPDHYCIRKGLTILDVASSDWSRILKVAKSTRPDEWLSFQVLPSVRARNLALALRRSQPATLKKVVFDVSKAVLDPLVADHFSREDDGLLLLDSVLGAEVASNTSVYALSALTAVVSSRLFKPQQVTPSLMRHVYANAVAQSRNPTGPGLACEALLAICASFVRPQHALEVLQVAATECQDTAFASIIHLIADENIPTAVAAVQLLGFVVSSSPLEENKRKNMVRLLMREGLYDQLDARTTCQDSSLRASVQQLRSMAHDAVASSKVDQVLHLHAGPKSLTAAFGVLRGRCEEHGCACDAYVAMDSLAGGPCSMCGHFPARHSHAGKVPLSPSPVKQLAVTSPTSKKPLSPGSKFDMSDSFRDLKQLLGSCNHEEEKRSEASSSVTILQDSDVTMLEQLGAGSFATVFRGTMPKSNQEVAVKVLSSKVVQLSDFLHELGAMVSFQSPHIVRIYGAITVKKFAIVMEFCARGSLFHVLNVRDAAMSRSLDWGAGLIMLQDCAAGLKALHDVGFIHRDIKSLNYLVTADMHCKLSDFGMAKLESRAQLSMSAPKGTLVFCAPEVLSGASGAQTQLSDVYSFAITMYEIIHRVVSGTYLRPYGEYPNMVFDFQIAVQVMQNNVRPTLPQNIPRQLKKIVTQAWMTEPEERPTISEIASVLSEIGERRRINPTKWQADLGRSGSVSTEEFEVERSSRRNLREAPL